MTIQEQEEKKNPWGYKQLTDGQMLVNKETEPTVKHLGKNAALSLMKKEINAAAKEKN